MRIPSGGLTHIVITCHFPLSTDLQRDIWNCGEKRELAHQAHLKSLLTEGGPGWTGRGPDVKGAVVSQHLREEE